MTAPTDKKRGKASTFSQGQPETLPSKAASIKYFPFLKNSLHRYNLSVFTSSPFTDVLYI